eukprot:6124496-Amphidinium_carterae.1
MDISPSSMLRHRPMLSQTQMNNPSKRIGYIQVQSPIHNENSMNLPQWQSSARGHPATKTHMKPHLSVENAARCPKKSSKERP